MVTTQEIEAKYNRATENGHTNIMTPCIRKYTVVGRVVLEYSTDLRGRWGVTALRYTEATTSGFSTTEEGQLHYSKEKAQEHYENLVERYQKNETIGETTQDQQETKPL